MTVDEIFIDRGDVRQAFDEARARHDLNLVWITGPGGQGKTMFVEQYLRSLDDGSFTGTSSCSTPLGEESTSLLKPYQPIKDVIQSLIGSKGQADRRRNLLKNMSLTLLASIPVVGDIGYAIKEIRNDLQEFKNSGGRTDYSRFEEEWIATILRISTTDPVVLFIDDVQWLDASSISALSTMISRLADSEARLTVILAGVLEQMMLVPKLREFYERSQNYSFTTVLPLPAFTPPQVKEYVHAWFPTAPEQESLYAWLMQRSHGTPFYVKAYLQHLRTTGALSEEGRVQEDLLTLTGIPEEVRLINKWIFQSLTEEDLTILLSASVLGYEFSLHELVHLTGLPTLDLIRRLRFLATSKGICEQLGYRLWNGKESTVYRFTQHAIHSALYHELTSEEREVLHRTTALYLDDLRHANVDSEVLNSIAPSLNVHAQLGRQPQLVLDSIMIQTTQSNAALDPEALQAQLDRLSPALGIDPQDLRRMVDTVASARSIHSPAALLQSMEEDLYGAGAIPALDDLVRRVMEGLASSRTGDLDAELERYARRIEHQQGEVHPLVHLLRGLIAIEVHDDTHAARTAFSQAAAMSRHPGYAALGTLAELLFSPNLRASDLATTLHSIQQVPEPHRPLVRALSLYLVKRRSATDPDIAAVLDSLAPFPPPALDRNFPKVGQYLNH